LFATNVSHIVMARSGTAIKPNCNLDQEVKSTHRNSRYATNSVASIHSAIQCGDYDIAVTTAATHTTYHYERTDLQPVADLNTMSSAAASNVLTL